uniref:Uncharacterized protein n=1 Tax=Periophthalmus magnuspinnatus TaxID=409849 RepID=A0A3B3ZB93_9GOBI
FPDITICPCTRLVSIKLLNCFGYNYIDEEPQLPPRKVLLDGTGKHTSPDLLSEEVTESNWHLEGTIENACPVPQGNQSKEEIQSSPVDLQQSEEVREDVMSGVPQEPSEALQEDTCTEITDHRLQLLNPNVLPSRCHIWCS